MGLPSSPPTGRTPPERLPGEARSARVDSARADSGQPGRSLTVLTWGGAYEASQRAAYFEPFTRQTGIAVDVERYDGGIDELRRHVDSGDPDWDVIDLGRRRCTGCLRPNHCSSRSIRAGWQQRMNRASMTTSTTAPSATARCPNCVSRRYLPTTPRAFPDEKPRQVRDFFDIDRFPGKARLALRPGCHAGMGAARLRRPLFTGVRTLLSTPRGLDPGVPPTRRDSSTSGLVARR